MNNDQTTLQQPFRGDDPDGAVPALFSEDAGVVADAIRALVRGPNDPGPVDRSAEANAVRTVTERIEALLGTDPAVLRHRLATHAELANALVVVYTRRAAAAAAPQSQAAYAGIALRAMMVGSRMVAMLGATAPQGGDDAGLPALPAGRDGA